jgi:hypothetical protein
MRPVRRRPKPARRLKLSPCSFRKRNRRPPSLMLCHSRSRYLMPRRLGSPFRSPSPPVILNRAAVIPLVRRSNRGFQRPLSAMGRWAAVLAIRRRHRPHSRPQRPQPQLQCLSRLLSPRPSIAAGRVALCRRRSRHQFRVQGRSRCRNTRRTDMARPHLRARLSRAPLGPCHLQIWPLQTWDLQIMPDRHRGIPPRRR